MSFVKEQEFGQDPVSVRDSDHLFLFFIGYLLMERPSVNAYLRRGK